MEDEKIRVRTENDRMLDVLVDSRRVDAIWIILGEGVNSLKCKLTPTDNGLAYAGSIMGREIVYERSVKQVRDDLAKQRQPQDRLPSCPGGNRNRGRR
ncbi:MAG: hypothetical protein AB7F20_11765 [Geoalkalibacter sp.]|jgi:hypothetical protein|uniref:hypothetical protein n=1 Tax=Geoalkalibacter sp. TaxID=3041440 RepID=UPI002A956283|nr:hypothetical protein [Thermodesulfobacteriota bacterium]